MASARMGARDRWPSLFVTLALIASIVVRASMRQRRRCRRRPHLQRRRRLQRRHTRGCALAAAGFPFATAAAAAGVPFVSDINADVAAAAITSVRGQHRSAAW